MVLATRLELSQLGSFVVCGGEVCNPVWHILESQMFTRPMPERENDLRADLRTCHFEAFVTYGNVSSKDYLGVIFGVIRIIYQECSKRWFQWRYVNRLTLQFSRKPEMYHMDF